eukprot:Hpha_TRINITY_DN15462_c0_g6::TRINITY_DN15462_c0_g6_i1::g.175670::m.175670
MATNGTGPAAKAPEGEPPKGEPKAEPKVHPWLTVVSEPEDGKQYRLEIQSGDWSAVTMAVLKSALVPKCGIAAEEQVLFYKGKECADKVSCEDIGIASREQLTLRKRAVKKEQPIEVQYFTEVIADAFLAFDSEMQRAEDEPGGIMSLDSSTRERLAKDLRRSLRGVEKRTSELERELAAVEGAADRYAEVILGARRGVAERFGALNALSGGRSILAVLRGDAPPLAPPLEAFFRRLAEVHGFLAKIAAMPPGAAAEACAVAAEVRGELDSMREAVATATSAGLEGAVVMSSATGAAQEAFISAVRRLCGETNGFEGIAAAHAESLLALLGDLPPPPAASPPRRAPSPP